MKEAVADYLRDPSRLDFKTEKVRDTEWKNANKPYLKYPAPGKISSAEAHFLYTIPFALGGGNYADVGVYKGKSSAILAHGIKESGRNGLLFSVDYFGTEPEDVQKFSDPTIPNLLRNYFAETKLDEFVHLQILAGNSAYYGGELQKLGFQLNFAFLDADHSYESVKKDFNVWSPLIHRGGMIGFHDCDFHGVDQTIKEMGPDWEFVRQVFSLKLFKRK